MSALNHATVRSGAWRVGTQAVQLALGIGSAATLARLISPASFGLFAMVTVLTELVGTFRDFGLPHAALQSKSLNHDELSALFWFSLRLNFITLILLALSAPLVALFFGEPALIVMTLVLAVCLFVGSLAEQSRSLMMRRFQFDQLALCELAALIASIAVAIGGGVLGWAHWALVAQLGTWQVVRAGLIVWRAKWVPTRGGVKEIGRLRDFGRNITLFRVVSHIGRNLDRVVVGRLSGTVALGLYNNAYRWSLFPIQQLYTPLMSVAVAGLSRAQDDATQFRRLVKRGIFPLYAIVTPVLAFLSLEATPVIHLLLGEQWLDAAPYFRLLCLAAFAESLNKLFKWLYTAQAQTRRQLTWGVLYTSGMVIAIAVGAQFGAYAVAIAFTAGSWLLLLPGLWLCLSVVPTTLRDLLDVLWRPILATLAGGLLLQFAPAAAPFARLLLSGTLFSIGYLIAWLLLPNGWQATRQLLRLFTYLRPKSAL